MRVWAAIVLATLAVVTAGAQGDAPTSTTSPAASPAAPQQTTEAQGQLPDLGGRWLVVMHLGPKTGQAGTTVIRLWNVTVRDGVPRLEERWVTLPPAIEARKRAGPLWSPSADDLRALGAAWDELPADERGVTTLKTELVDQAHFDDVLKAEDNVKDAPWVVRQSYEYERSTNRPVREVDVLAGGETTPDGHRGRAVLVMLAMAPFPVPIELVGTYEMYRLTDQPKGLLARLLDVFSGCGRTATH